MAPIDPHALELVRLANGLSQSGLSRKLGGALSQAWISNVEAGKFSPTVEHAVLLAEALGCPVELLAQPAGDLSLGAACAHYRKRSDLQVSKANQLAARLSLSQLLTRGASDRVPTLLPRATPTDDGFITPDDVARQVRRELNIPPGPIDDLAATLRDAGVTIVSWSLGSDRVDALSQWPDEGHPLVLVCANTPGDRKRYTLAHETGHLVMHSEPREDQEREADQFAAEFLMPADQIRGRFADLTLTRLAALKAEWGTSMAALLRRGRDLGEVPERRYRALNIEISRAGYRRHEPVPIDRDSTFGLVDSVHGDATWVQESAIWLERLSNNAEEAP